MPIAREICKKAESFREKSIFEMNVSDYHFKTGNRLYFLLVSQTFDRIQPGSFACREDAEDQADADGNGQAGDDRPERNYRGKAGDEQHYQLADADRQRYADQTAEKCKRHCFEQELQNDRFFGCTDGFANADLFCSFGDRNEHDVHHADAADEQAETRDRDRDQADAADDAVKLGDKIIGGLDVEIIRIAVFYAAPLAQNAFDLEHRVV